MKIHSDIIQGSDTWHELRASVDGTASEAAAMLGLSKYMSRSELLRQKATGEVEEVTPAKQKIFARGHEVEELARPIAEAHIGEELYPATITNEIEGLNLLASMDGMTMMGDVGFEHKMTNAELMALVNEGTVPDTHWPQLEQQMMVSQVEKILFVVSDGTEENRAQCWYESVPARRKQVIEGWKQFKADLENYVPEAKAEVVEAEPVRELPAIRYEMNGLALSSNLEAYKQAATDLVEASKAPLESDQDFANAEARQKIFTKAEKACEEICEKALGEVASIDEFVKDVRFIKEQMRQARLAESKQIKARKDEIRGEILHWAQTELQSAIAHANAKIGAEIPALKVDIAGEMKGKKTRESLKDAAMTELANAKMKIAEFKGIAADNKVTLNEHDEYRFLFNDWAQIAFKAPDDFKALVTARIAEYEQQKAAELEAERSRIRAEEEAKAMREAEEKARQEQAQRDAELKAQREAELKAEAERAQSNPATADMAEQAAREDEDEKPETQTAKAAEPVAISHSGSKATAPRKLALMEVNAVVNFIAWAKVEDKSIADTLDNLYSQYLEQREAV